MNYRLFSAAVAASLLSASPYLAAENTVEQEPADQAWSGEDGAPIEAQEGGPATLKDLTIDSPNETKRAICDMITEAAATLSSQMPVTVDPSTQLVGADTVYFNGICTYNLQYLVSESDLFERLQESLSEEQGETLEMDVVRSLYAKGAPGYMEMKQALSDGLMGNEAFAGMANIPFVEVRANYDIQGEIMGDFELLLGRDES